MLLVSLYKLVALLEKEIHRISEKLTYIIFFLFSRPVNYLTRVAIHKTQIFAIIPIKT